MNFFSFRISMCTPTICWDIFLNQTECTVRQILDFPAILHTFKEN